MQPLTARNILTDEDMLAPLISPGVGSLIQSARREATGSLYSTTHLENVKRNSNLPGGKEFAFGNGTITSGLPNMNNTQSLSQYLSEMRAHPPTKGKPRFAAIADKVTIQQQQLATILAKQLSTQPPGKGSKKPSNLFLKVNSQRGEAMNTVTHSAGKNG